MEYDPANQMLSWFKDRYLDGSLRIRPPYQRRPIWSSRQKCYLIESMLLGLPVPEIYLQQSVTAEGRSSYAVVDGQQRIRTALQFVGAETDPQEQDQNRFALDRLPTTSAWYGMTFSDLDDETKRRLYGYRFMIRLLKTDSEQEVRDMFGRLNRFLTPLNAQELRNATYTGPFARLAEELADDQYWSESRLVSPTVIRRMGDVEFMSELLIGALHGPQGGRAAEIDGYYRRYEDCDVEFPEQRPAVVLFRLALDKVRALLPDIKRTRWGNRTDFYSLFVALAALLRSSTLPRPKVRPLRAALLRFAGDVDRRLADEKAHVSDEVIAYVRAVEKGPNEKSRRAARHEAVLSVIGAFFRPKRRSG